MKVEKRYTLGSPKGLPFVSVAIATHNKGSYLRRTLQSIRDKNKLCPFEYEIIVVDDKSTDDTFEVCKDFEVIYARLPENPRRNPSVPRNASFRLARGKVIVHQSDEVLHNTEDSLEKLANLVTNYQYVIATVHNVNPETLDKIDLYTGYGRQKPYFFLGAIAKRSLDICGGYDEDFIAPGYDDDKLADDLQRIGVYPTFTDLVHGSHLDHSKGKMSCGIDSSALYYGRKMYDSLGGTNVVQV